MHTRQAGLSDSGSIAAIHTESWRNAYSGLVDAAYLSSSAQEDHLRLWSSSFAELLVNKNILVAEIADDIVGFVCAIGREDEYLRTLIDNLHVRPGLKGSGIGTVLMRAIARWSLAVYPEAGLHLWCFEHNEPARRFYEQRCGIITERTLHESPGGTLSPCVHFVWSDPTMLLLDINFDNWMPRA